MPRELYEVWDTKDGTTRPWAVQLIKYVAYFTAEGAAHRYVEMVRAERKKQGLK